MYLVKRKSAFLGLSNMQRKESLENTSTEVNQVNKVLGLYRLADKRSSSRIKLGMGELASPTHRGADQAV